MVAQQRALGNARAAGRLRGEHRAASKQDSGRQALDVHEVMPDGNNDDTPMAGQGADLARNVQIPRTVGTPRGLTPSTESPCPHLLQGR
jgi:hypothetical protein